MRRFYSVLTVMILAGCATIGGISLDERYGSAQPRDRLVADTDTVAYEYYRDIKPLLNKRCVVCHGCYDAPCQLRMGAFEGLDRGANKDKVYNGSRLVAANLTRLFEDADSVEGWRKKGFYPVLNERAQTREANIEAGVMARLLELKQEHPLPDSGSLPDSLDVSLDRRQECPTTEEMDEFTRRHPLWGMPYALLGLSGKEHNMLITWLGDGAPWTGPPAIADDFRVHIDEWEAFLNEDSLKRQLMSRYIYEHLFVANIHFDEVPGRQFFRLVRSRTPPGEPVELIATRRPYDDPGVGRVYYRLQPVHSTILLKTHMPYAFNQARMERYRQLFLTDDYEVKSLPSYNPAVASNAFVAFADLPPESRYRFMLDEAQFIIMGFIKGPVCRGQVALNVIEDHFWVAFTNPAKDPELQFPDYLIKTSNNLRLPSQAESNALPVSTWIKYTRLHQNYLKDKSALMHKVLHETEDITLDLVWDGDGWNTNAALTIFRHFDSASVVKGFVGDIPKTAWIIDYPMLERIHYLLVAGFDVYGNVGHQLNTRLYMDLLRMEGEFNFLTLLPREDRVRERDYWYRGASREVKDYIFGKRINFDQQTDIRYTTDDPKTELLNMIRSYLGPAMDRAYHIPEDGDPVVTRELNRLSSITGTTLFHLPQTITLSITETPDGPADIYTLVHNNGHSNVAYLFGEGERLRPSEDTLTVAHGFIGAYPNVFYRSSREELPELVQVISSLRDKDDYSALLDRFGIRRTDPEFWAHSDEMMTQYHRIAPLEAGLFDYNRLDPR